MTPWVHAIEANEARLLRLPGWYCWKDGLARVGPEEPEETYDLYATIDELRDDLEESEKEASQSLFDLERAEIEIADLKGQLSELRAQMELTDEERELDRR